MVISLISLTSITGGLYTDFTAATNGHVIVCTQVDVVYCTSTLSNPVSSWLLFAQYFVNPIHYDSSEEFVYGSEQAAFGCRGTAIRDDTRDDVLTYINNNRARLAQGKYKPNGLSSSSDINKLFPSPPIGLITESSDSHKQSHKRSQVSLAV
ncbi:hypothetical protein KIN20_030173 [Parelaphostrongylus tenuis]|uniref:Uncharacterized protein n=1 Tax=Parelaphostrongylus tenuis TaxID=148309 RepID=A0AAD5R495_PARTN|nr:hypothetical protein KIN20_030173 [Parelaphostrongylus tenuis]